MEFLIFQQTLLGDMDPSFYNNLIQAPVDSFYPAMKGGATIAMAATVYYLLFGGILGMSGLTGSVVKFPQRSSTKLKAIILLGMLSSSAAILYYQQSLSGFSQFMHLPFDSKTTIDSIAATHLIVAGLLVGIGTDLSNGCTSGHGLCGMPRLSLRSLTAVLVFLSTAVATATFSLKSFIPDVNYLSLPFIDQITIPPQVFLVAAVVLALLLIASQKEKSLISKLTLFFIGSVFGFGLMMAGMSHQSKIYGFLHLNANWDPTLLFVLMTGVTINTVTFNIIICTMKNSVYGQKIENSHGKITGKLLLGAFLFGIGWGIGGLCPGPFVLSIPYSMRLVVYWGIPFMIGQKLSYLLWGEKDLIGKVDRKLKQL